jgi:hypothetical protein
LEPSVTVTPVRLVTTATSRDIGRPYLLNSAW